MSDESEAAMAHARDRLAALRNEFAGRLRDRITELERAVQEAREEPAAVVRTQQLAHKLAGTAGSFGFHAAGELAAELEQLCSDGFDADRADGIVERLRTTVE